MALELHIQISILNTDPVPPSEGGETIVMRSQISSSLMPDVDQSAEIPVGSVQALARSRLDQLVDWARRDMDLQLETGEQNAGKQAAAGNV